jgi:hypothetical protein
MKFNSYLIMCLLPVFPASVLAESFSIEIGSTSIKNTTTIIDDLANTSYVESMVTSSYGISLAFTDGFFKYRVGTLLPSENPALSDDEVPYMAPQYWSPEVKPIAYLDVNVFKDFHATPSITAGLELGAGMILFSFDNAELKSFESDASFIYVDNLDSDRYDKNNLPSMGDGGGFYWQYGLSASKQLKDVTFGLSLKQRFMSVTKHEGYYRGRSGIFGTYFSRELGVKQELSTPGPTISASISLNI